jgi:hypothetical protein
MPAAALAAEGCPDKFDPGIKLKADISKAEEGLE